MSKNVAEALRIVGQALMLQKEDRERLNAAIDAVEAERAPSASPVRGGTTGAAAPVAKKRKK